MNNLIDKLVRSLTILILGAMVLIVGGNVFYRFVLQHSLYWADELAQILLVWLTFIGGALAVKEKTHYVLNFLTDRMHGKSQRYFKLFQQIISILAILMLLYFSAKVTWDVRFWKMPATEVSRSFVYIACPLGCLLMLYYAIKLSVNEFLEKTDKDEEHDALV